MNQITLLYTPMRYVSAVEVKQGDEKLFDLEGSDLRPAHFVRLPDQRRVRDFGDHDGHERNRVEARLPGRLEQLTFGRRRRRRFVSAPCRPPRRGSARPAHFLPHNAAIIIRPRSTRFHRANRRSLRRGFLMPPATASGRLLR